MNEMNGIAGENIHVLLVEDNPADSLLIRSMLQESRHESFTFSTAGNLSECFKWIAEIAFDIVLLDLTLPDTHGLETFSAVYSKIPDTPVIVLSGLDDESIAIRAVHMGTQDYLVKGQLDQSLLHRSVRYAIERKRIEQRLRESETLYQSLVENLPQNILRKDLNGHFTFANQRFCTELGMTTDEIIGKSDFDLYPMAMAAMYRDSDRQVMKTGRIYEAVEDHPTPGGSTKYVQVVKIPNYDETGQIIGTQIICWDVTEKTLAEEKVRKANSELGQNREELLKALTDLQHSHDDLKDAQMQLLDMEKMQTIGQLAAGVAHEVKNPLAILRMGVDFLNNRPGLNEGKPGIVLADMADAIHRADTIITDMLDLSAHRQFAMNPFNLNDLVGESFRLVQHEFKGNGHEIVQIYGADLPNGLGDVNKLKQAFVNLFTNAAQAMTEAGTLTITTRLGELSRIPEESAKQEGKRDTFVPEAGDLDLIVEIADTGRGIPEEDLKRIFDPFFTTKSAGSGTGLGLSVTRKIVELHHGHLEIENRHVKGALVRVSLLSQRPAL